jgi:hypothetical protein
MGAGNIIKIMVPDAAPELIIARKFAESGSKQQM